MGNEIGKVKTPTLSHKKRQGWGTARV